MDLNELIARVYRAKAVMREAKADCPNELINITITNVPLDVFMEYANIKKLLVTEPTSSLFNRYFTHDGRIRIETKEYATKVVTVFEQVEL